MGYAMWSLMERMVVRTGEDGKRGPGASASAERVVASTTPHPLASEAQRRYDFLHSC